MKAKTKGNMVKISVLIICCFMLHLSAGDDKEKEKKKEGRNGTWWSVTFQVYRLLALDMGCGLQIVNKA